MLVQPLPCGVLYYTLKTFATKDKGAVSDSWVGFETSLIIVIHLDRIIYQLHYISTSLMIVIHLYHIIYQHLLAPSWYSSRDSKYLDKKVKNSSSIVLGCHTWRYNNILSLFACVCIRNNLSASCHQTYDSVH